MPLFQGFRRGGTRLSGGMMNSPLRQPHLRLRGCSLFVFSSICTCFDCMRKLAQALPSLARLVNLPPPESYRTWTHEIKTGNPIEKARKTLDFMGKTQSEHEQEVYGKSWQNLTKLGKT